MTRLKPQDPQTFTDQQAAIYQSIMNGPRGKFGGPFPALIHAPEITDRVQSLGESLRFNTALPSDLREIAILTVARYWKNEVEWNAHVVIAIKEGVSTDLIQRILYESPADQVCEKYQVVLNFCSQLQNNQTIENDTYGLAIELLGIEQVVELISIVGYFTLLSMVLNSFEIDADPKDGIPPKSLMLSTINNTEC